MTSFSPSTDRGIAAYDIDDRVARYDADMALFHPNHGRLLDMLVTLLRLSTTKLVRVLDLGAGTGRVTDRIVTAFPDCRVTAVDGAQAMLEMAEVRLEGHLGIAFVKGDFRELLALVPATGTFDAVVSCFALHHLDSTTKRSVLKQCYALLRPGGVLLNADIVVADSATVESWYQRERIEGIVRRAAGRDPRFRDVRTATATLSDQSTKEGDQPLALVQDLALLAMAGFRDIEVHWKELREAVYGGRK